MQEKPKKPKKESIDGWAQKVFFLMSDDSLSTNGVHWDGVFFLNSLLLFLLSFQCTTDETTLYALRRIEWGGLSLLFTRGEKDGYYFLSPYDSSGTDVPFSISFCSILIDGNVIFLFLFYQPSKASMLLFYSTFPSLYCFQCFEIFQQIVYARSMRSGRGNCFIACIPVRNRIRIRIRIRITVSRGKGMVHMMHLMQGKATQGNASKQLLDFVTREYILRRAGLRKREASLAGRKGDKVSEKG